MPTWELINPSDKYTFRTDDFEALAFGILMLSEGSYSVQELDVDNPRSSPILIFGGDPNEWWQETFGHKVEGFKPWHKRVADALDTIVIGDRDDFEAALAAIPDEDAKAKFTAKWNDRKRSSMNDIGHAVRSWVTKLRKLEMAS